MDASFYDFLKIFVRISAGVCIMLHDFSLLRIPACYSEVLQVSDGACFSVTG